MYTEWLDESVSTPGEKRSLTISVCQLPQAEAGAHIFADGGRRLKDPLDTVSRNVLPVLVLRRVRGQCRTIVDPHDEAVGEVSL